MKQLVHPYTDLTNGRWLRGNLHTHTTRSDGERAPQAVIDDYASRGYGFLMLSDHDTLDDEALYATLDSRGMVLVPGNEVSANGPHMLHVYADRVIEPYADRQKVIDEAKTGRGFIIVNHPDWFPNFDHCTLEQLMGWSDYVGIEIYNGTIGRLEGSQYALNKWDMLLSRGRRAWGYAHDDVHLAKGEVGLGWNMAYVRDPSAASVVEALRTGRCYASTGVTITGIHVDGLHVRVETANAQRIVASCQHGRRFAIADERAIEVDVPADTPYARFTCWGPGEQFAWTQPFYVQSE